MLVENLGQIEYGEGLAKQDQAIARVAKAREGLAPSGPNPAEIIFICEHPKVITVGRAAGARQEVLSDQIPVFEISRGGRATLHLPGQVVVYPILDLARRGKDLHGLMRSLEQAVIETLGEFRIEADRVEEKTGVWVNKQRKIASIGIGAKDWISSHGVALNVVCDLTAFQNLNPCGFDPKVMTSMLAEFSPRYRDEWQIQPQRLFKQVSSRLVENLQYQL